MTSGRTYEYDWKGTENVPMRNNKVQGVIGARVWKPFYMSHINLRGILLAILRSKNNL